MGELLARGVIGDRGGASQVRIDFEQKELPMPTSEFTHLAAGINSGLRGAILLSLVGNSPKTHTEIRHILQERTGLGPLITDANQISELLKNLERFQLVQRVQNNAQDGFALKPYGEHIAVAYTGFAGPLAWDIGQKLSAIWGESTQRKPDWKETMTPDGPVKISYHDAQIRYGIFRALLREKQRVKSTKKILLRQADIAQVVGCDDRTVGLHLESLSANKLVHYERLTENRDTSCLHQLANEMPENDPPPYQNQPLLTGDVLTALEELGGRGTPEEVTEFIQRVFVGRDIRNKARLQDTVQDVMAHLEKHGFLKQRLFNSFRQTRVTLDREQYELMSKLMSSVTDFMMYDPRSMENYRRIAISIYQQPTLLVKLLKV